MGQRMRELAVLLDPSGGFSGDFDWNFFLNFGLSALSSRTKRNDLFLVSFYKIVHRGLGIKLAHLVVLRATNTRGRLIKYDAGCARLKRRCFFYTQDHFSILEALQEA